MKGLSTAESAAGPRVPHTTGSNGHRKMMNQRGGVCGEMPDSGSGKCRIVLLEPPRSPGYRVVKGVKRIRSATKGWPKPITLTRSTAPESFRSKARTPSVSRKK